MPWLPSGSTTSSGAGSVSGAVTSMATLAREVPSVKAMFTWALPAASAVAVAVRPLPATSGTLGSLLDQTGGVAGWTGAVPLSSRLALRLAVPPTSSWGVSDSSLAERSLGATLRTMV